MPAAIVAFVPEHIPAAIKLWSESPGVKVNETDTPAGLLRFLERNPGLSLAVIDEGEVVGTLLCGHDGRRGYLQHMAVAEPYRQMGLGRQLVDGCLHALHEIDIHKCHVFVVRDNPFAGLFWERLGWVLRDDVHIYSGTSERPKSEEE